VRAFRVAYDGTGYHGFQRQPDVPTVEDALLNALRALDVLAADGATEADGATTPGTPRRTPPGYAAAGRTDAGVSAVAQTVAFDAPAWLTPAAFNGELPAEVRAWASTDVPADFHATRDATRRAYTYHLHAPEADDARVRAVLEALAGEHDFHNLTPDDAGTERDLDAGWARDGEFLVLRFRAGGFPREFVRRSVALVASVATGERDPGFVDRVLSPEELSGPDGVPAAAPEPLVLTAVEYPDATFEVDDRAAANAWTVFERRRVERQTGARVAAMLRSGASRK